MKFVLFETERGIWVTTPDKEKACIAEMLDSGVVNGDWDRHERTVETSLLIEARTHWVFSD